MCDRVALMCVVPGPKLVSAHSLPAAILRQFERHVGRIFAVALVTIGAGVTLAHHQSAQHNTDERWVSHTRDVLSEFDALLSSLDDAELREQEFALTGDDKLLAPFERDGMLVEEHLDRVHALVADNPAQQRRVDGLKIEAARKMTAMRKLIAARRRDGLEGAARVAIEGAAASELSSIRDTVRALERDEQRLLTIRQDAQARSKRHTTWAILALGVTSLTMLTLSFFVAQRARRRQTAAELSAVRANHELRQYVDELLLRGRESAGLQQLNVALQLCITAGEAHAAVNRILPTMLGASSSGGVLAVLRSPKSAERVATWGDQSGAGSLQAMPSEDCLALRSGRPYVVQPGGPGLRCVHTDSDHYLCLPLAAHGETLGVLQVFFPGSERRADKPDFDSADTDPGSSRSVVEAGLGTGGDRRLALLQRASEQVAITLANLALRERLEHQSVRDPLTGTFNRRYFEESLERELARERRHPRGLALVMVDIDHFKSVNDTHGHEAGDDALKMIAGILQRTVRASDLVCRVGGEEFAIVLPDIGEEPAHLRAQTLVEACRASRLMAHGRVVGPVTISAGLARHVAGESGTDMVRRADAALYAAKRGGRDRLVDSTSAVTNAESALAES